MQSGYDMALSKIDSHVGARILFRRLQLSKSQDELSLKLGVSPETYARFEAGAERASVEQLAKICLLLNMKPMDVYRGLYAGGAGTSSMLKSDSRSALS